MSPPLVKSGVGVSSVRPFLTGRREDRRDLSSLTVSFVVLSSSVLLLYPVCRELGLVCTPRFLFRCNSWVSSKFRVAGSPTTPMSFLPLTFSSFRQLTLLLPQKPRMDDSDHPIGTIYPSPSGKNHVKSSFFYRRTFQVYGRRFSFRLTLLSNTFGKCSSNSRPPTRVVSGRLC